MFNFTTTGPVVGEILEDIIPMLIANLKPDKDPEVKLKMFSLLSKLMMNAPTTVNSKQMQVFFITLSDTLH